MLVDEFVKKKAEKQKARASRVLAAADSNPSQPRRPSTVLRVNKLRRSN